MVKLNMQLFDYIQRLSASGRCCFTSTDAEKALGVSRKASIMALARLTHKGLVVSPAKQFYLIIPPEYMSLGCLPPDQFIPHLMKYWELPYYVTLLSAAEYYGAGHQKSQYFQVMTTINKPDLYCGHVQVRFIKKKIINTTPIKTFNTSRSVVRVSSPEATMMDLINYPRQSGGLNHVATVLSELVESIDAEKLIQLAKESTSLAWIQRLGYLLQVIDDEKLTLLLKDELKGKKARIVPLDTNKSITGYPRDPEWRVAINMKIESDL